jgi:hypothetical protein
VNIERFVVKPKTLVKTMDGLNIRGRLVSIETMPDGGATVAIDTADRMTQPEPVFDREMQAIAHIEYQLGQFHASTKLRILRFVEDRVNQKE